VFSGQGMQDRRGRASILETGISPVNASGLWNLTPVTRHDYLSDRIPPVYI
jgi:hypothetical protein